MKKITLLDYAYHEHQINHNHKPISVILDNIRSLYNVGSIFRTSDAAGVEKLYLCGITGTPPRAEIHKAALGAEKIVPWEYHKSAIDVISELKNKGYKVFVLEHTDNGIFYYKAKYEYPLCLIVGHEVTGIQDKIVSLADQAIEIPMSGIKRSLNVAVAYGIAIFEITKKLYY